MVGKTGIHIKFKDRERPPVEFVCEGDVRFYEGMLAVSPNLTDSYLFPLCNIHQITIIRNIIPIVSSPCTAPDGGKGE